MRNPALANHNNGRKRRLNGGPTLPEPTCMWFDDEAARVKEKDKRLACTVKDLLYEIAQADLDLSHNGIETYKALNLKSGGGRHARSALIESAAARSAR